MAKEDGRAVGRPEMRPGRITVELPWGEAGDGYMPRHIEVNRLTERQGLTLKRLVAGADAAGVRLANGKRVTTMTDGVRMLLEMCEKPGR